MHAKYRRLREQAYEQGRVEFDELVTRPTFRDFVVLYIAEASKRDRNRARSATPTLASLLRARLQAWIDRVQVS